MSTCSGNAQSLVETKFSEDTLSFLIKFVDWIFEDNSAINSCPVDLESLKGIVKSSCSNISADDSDFFATNNLKGWQRFFDSEGIPNSYQDPTLSGRFAASKNNSDNDMRRQIMEVREQKEVEKQLACETLQAQLKSERSKRHELYQELQYLHNFTCPRGLQMEIQKLKSDLCDEKAKSVVTRNVKIAERGTQTDAIVSIPLLDLSGGVLSPATVRPAMSSGRVTTSGSLSNSQVPLVVDDEQGKVIDKLDSKISVLTSKVKELEAVCKLKDELVASTNGMMKKLEDDNKRLLQRIKELQLASVKAVRQCDNDQNEGSTRTEELENDRSQLLKQHQFLLKQSVALQEDNDRMRLLLDRHCAPKTFADEEYDHFSLSKNYSSTPKSYSSPRRLASFATANNGKLESYRKSNTLQERAKSSASPKYANDKRVTIYVEDGGSLGSEGSRSSADMIREKEPNRAATRVQRDRERDARERERDTREREAQDRKEARERMDRDNQLRDLYRGDMSSPVERLKDDGSFFGWSNKEQRSHSAIQSSPPYCDMSPQTSKTPQPSSLTNHDFSNLESTLRASQRGNSRFHSQNTDISASRNVPPNSPNKRLQKSYTSNFESSKNGILRTPKKNSPLFHANNEGYSFREVEGNDRWNVN
eukprot:Platyproteum_vivax@DN6902_c0_g1_i1.p1